MIRLIAIAFLLSVQAAFGQAAKIISGEHDNFSRLVVTLPSTVAWTFERVDEGYAFRTTNWREGFDISEVFEMIPKTRLAGIDPNNSGFILELACDCEAFAAGYNGAYVIIDIAELLPPDPQILVESARLESPDLDEIATQDTSARLLDETNISQTKQIGLEDIDTETPDDRVPLDAAQRKLIEGFSRAAGLDLLQPRSDIAPPTLTKEPPPNVEPRDVAANDPEPVERSVEDRAADRIRVRSAVDLARLVEGPTEERQAAQCVSDKDWEIAQWGDGTSYSMQLGKLRSELVEDISQVNADAALRLVRLYLHFGLGPEAIQAAKGFDLSKEQRGIVQFIAAIIDNAPIVPDILPENAQTCGKNQAFWDILAQGSENELDEKATAALTALFLEMPAHLKSLLGPKLIAALNTRGNTLAAKVIHRAISNSSQPPSGIISLSAIDSTSEIAIKQLRQVIAQNDQDGPEAMILYLRMMLENSQLPSEKDIILAEAFHKQLEGTQTASDLYHEIVRAHSATDQFRMALSMITKLPIDEASELLSWIVTDLALSTSNISVVDAVVIINELAFLSSVPDIKLGNLAERMRTLGMPSLSVALIENAGKREALRSDYIRGFIADGQYEQAERELAQYEGPDEASLRIDLELKQGRADRLPRSLVETAAQDQMAQLAWLSGQHDLLNDGDIRTLAVQRLNRSEPAQTQEIGLDAMTSQIEQSSQTRTVILDLLADEN